MTHASQLTCASVHAYFTSKGSKKSAVAIQHGGLPSKKRMERSKAFWADRLEALGEVLRA